MGAGTHPQPGVLALQGSVEPHLDVFRRLGCAAREVRRLDDLTGITHLVLPGGESTTFQKLLELYDLWEPIQRGAQAGTLALFGTCAGAILLGRTSKAPPPRWGVLDVTVERNSYGSQIDSFVAEVEVLGPSGEPDALEGIFIRAPRFRDLGPEVHVLGQRTGEPVLVRQGRMLASAFHPELTRATRLHEHFLTL